MESVLTTWAEPSTESVALVRELGLHGPQTRGALADRLELSVSSVGRVLDRLQHQRLVRSGAPVAGAVGRPAVLYELTSDRAFTVGLCTFRGSVEAAAYDLGWRRVGRATVEAPVVELPREELLEALASAAHQAVRAAGRPADSLLAIGCSVWGSVIDPPSAGSGAPRNTIPGGRDSTATLFWPQRRDLRDVPVAGFLADRFGVPAVADDGARYVAREIQHRRRLSGRDVGSHGADFLLVEESGAAAAVLGGAVYRGTRGLGGQLAHFVADPDGDLCQCGNRGCLCTVTDLTVLRRRLAETADLGLHPSLRKELDDDSERTESPTGYRWRGSRIGPGSQPSASLARALNDAASDGDRLAASVLSRIGIAVGGALATAVNLLGVETAYVLGSLVGSSQVAQQALRQELGLRTVETLAPRVELHFMCPGEDDGLLGAAQQALDHALSSSGVALDALRKF